jgi:MFS family permease
MSSLTSTEEDARRRWSPWRAVVAFGLVSLAADMVYEGMRSVSGPFLASLGASALVVGLVTGAGEAAALVLRLVSGPLADRGGRHWELTIAGYALTAVCVPLLAVAPFVGGLGLGLAAGLILLERTGKAVRSPSKSALLAGFTVEVGRGRGFAVHKALDQVGAFAGPLLVAGVIALAGATWPAFVALAVPGLVAMALLLALRARVGAPRTAGRPGRATRGAPTELPGPAPRLPRRFYAFAASCACGSLGLMTFGVISFHLVDAGLLGTAAVPLVYAGAMAAEAVAALGTGFAYDRWGAPLLLVLPAAVAAVPALALADQLAVVLLGILVWGLVTGVQDSTVKALVADLVPAPRLATAYGVFAAFQGAAALGGGVLAGGLYADHRALLVGTVAVLQALSAGLLVVTLWGGRPTARTGSPRGAGGP